MAWTGNFKDQIDNLAGTLTVTDDDAIQQWILDGCYDVMSKAVGRHGEEEAWKFVAKSGSQTSNDIDVDEIRTIAGVMRNNIFAIQGTWQLKAKYADAGSIYAATADNPVWYLDDSKLSVYPAPNVSNPVNYYYVPEYVLDSWNSSTSSIDNYPSEYYYHAMLYASIQVLSRRMLDLSAPTAVSELSITSVPPDAPTIDAISYTNVTPATATVADIAAVTSYSITNVVDPAASQPTYIPPAPPDRPDFESSVTDEDEEIVGMKAQQYQADLSAYQSELSDAMNEFNENNAIYSQLAKQAGDNATVTNQAALQNMQKDLQIAQTNNQKLTQVAQINTANAQQALMQDAIQQVQDVIANNNSLIQEYQANLGAYQAEVGTEVQEYSANLQRLGANLASTEADYKWLDMQYNKLRFNYESLFSNPANQGGPAQAS